MAYVGIVVVIIIMVVFGIFIFRFINRKDSARMNRLHARSVRLRDNAQRVHEEQERLRNERQ